MILAYPDALHLPTLRMKSPARCALAALLLLGVPFSAGSAATPVSETGFSTERAMAHVRMLADTIGPRPMGSPSEQRALEYALQRLHEFGCQDTFLMRFNEAAGVNTRSGIAVGVLKGETNRIIVIGGHIDSSGPEIPGANDDASGSACVLEIARVLARQPHYSTYVFCLWGGEEEGLRGSQYFVDHYPSIDSVRLMLQIDMADGAGMLEVDPDASYQVSAPRWLVEAAYDVFYHELRYSGLRYMTQFSTLNASGTGSTGSDHQPFLQRGIPAIDFTSDIAFP
ncbi:MAG: Zn-dependent exopeptidase M28, partial [Acidobacteria bacterium]